MSIKRWKLGLKRCNCVKCESAITFEQTEENCGWVMWVDHKDEVTRLNAEVERLKKLVGLQESIDKSIDAWIESKKLAAKEGKKP